VKGLNYQRLNDNLNVEKTCSPVMQLLTRAEPLLIPSAHLYTATWLDKLPSISYLVMSPPSRRVPHIPSLRTLATFGLRGECFTDAYLIAIIIKAQPHHSDLTLRHLTRMQLIAHVDSLVAWWKQAHRKSPPPSRGSSEVMSYAESSSTDQR
jgi:hypothetical protein